MPEEGKAKKKCCELSASPLFSRALVKRMVKQFQSHFALPKMHVSTGVGDKGRATGISSGHRDAQPFQK